MPIDAGDLKLYGSAVMPEDDLTTQIGGAIATSVKPWFVDPATDTLQAVSTASGDTTQSLTVTYRDPSGVIQTLTVALNGTTVVTNATTVARILKAVKSASCTGRVGLEGQTAVRTGTAQGGGSNVIDLDAGASTVDQAYRGMIVRLTGGTGSGQLAQIVRYDGAQRRASINEAWPTATPTATTTFRISKGCFFDKIPAEILTVRRPFYKAEANAPGLGVKTIYELVYLKNTHGTLTLTSAQVLEEADPTAKFTFGLGAAINTAYTNGAGNARTVAPAGVTINSAGKAVPGGQLGPGDSIAVWLAYTMADGDVARDTTHTPALQGLTV